MTRPYSTSIPPSTPIRTPFSHHSSSLLSSRLKPSGFPVPVTPVVATTTSSRACSSPFRSHQQQQRQRPANLLSSTDPHHHGTTTDWFEPPPPPSADRFIPNRSTMNIDVARRALFSANNKDNDRIGDKRKQQNDSSDDDASAVPSSFNRLQKAYKRQMMSTLCNVPLNHLDEDGEPKSFLFGGSANSNRDRHGSLSNTTTTTTTTTTTAKNNVENSLPRWPDPFALDFLRSMKVGTTDTANEMAPSSTQWSASSRKLPDRPFKVLDAYNVRNDFYLSILSWNHENILAVALGTKIYLYNVATGQVDTIFEEGNEGHYIMSVKWCDTADGGHSHYLAVTTSSNNAVMVFDCHAMQRVDTRALVETPSDRVFSMSWKDQHFLSAGTSNGTILNFDIRSHRRYPVSRCQDGHSSQVCGLAWSPDGSTLASGGNDDTLCLWDQRIIPSTTPSADSSGMVLHRPRVHLPKAHNAAIKAIAWCPHMSNLLATGGGTRDRTIKIWNTSSGCCLKNSVETGSQVSSLVWSKHNMELCSAHGYMHNQVSLWHCHYPSLTKMKDFKFHNDRILSMEMSPDGSTLATLGSDEMLGLWNMFGNPLRAHTAATQNYLFPSFGAPEIR